MSVNWMLARLERIGRETIKTDVVIAIAARDADADVVAVALVVVVADVAVGIAVVAELHHRSRRRVDFHVM